MNDDRDPLVQNLFAGADEVLLAEPFVGAIETKLAARRPWRWPLLVLLIAVLLLGAALLAAPLQSVVLWLSQALMMPLVDLTDPTLAALLLPVNTAAAPIALGLLLLRFAFQRLAA